MSELTIVLKVEVGGGADDVTPTLGTATAQVVRAGAARGSNEVDPTVILVRIER